ncbi:hypothetical protein BDZ90DRAFT_65859 [Jaminaea rosea]|uniref:Alpha/beta-hydrolase n=1 Tax=Jaminaea rosea TaxID=1569628 RepID=A0A316UKS3_9BASI|nr:hypothetical protein BDZ90DRAFT_65859 [Jaminaea rosea]PWN25902.1 hypothetical protein BDZ90DRAFT_65859 [Jaminaea rosea]
MRHLSVFPPLIFLVSAMMAVASARHVSLPRGASLIHLSPCGSSPGVVPAFVNSGWAHPNQTSHATTAYITQHGTGAHFDVDFAAVHNVVGDQEAVVIAPAFHVATAPRSRYYSPDKTLAWADGEVTWAGGYDSVSPFASSCSSFRTYEAILAALTDRSRFPALHTIVWAGHSAGASMVQRWSVLSPESAGHRTRYILANAPETTYFSDVRPREYDRTACPGAGRYPFQWTRQGGGMPRYVAERDGGGEEAAFRGWAGRDVTILIGDRDTESRFPGGDEGCAPRSQGGVNRRERNYAAWAYSVLLAGAGAREDVSRYTGYDYLKSRVSPVGGVTFRHKVCVMGGVGHDATAVYASQCGRDALFDRGLKASVGASYP